MGAGGLIRHAKIIELYWFFTYIMIDSIIFIFGQIVNITNFRDGNPVISQLPPPLPQPVEFKNKSHGEHKKRPPADHRNIQIAD